MKNNTLRLDISRQPNDSTCGPTSLHAVYNYYNEDLSLEEVIKSIEYLKTGGTLAVMLGIDALNRGYMAEIVTFNLKIFDPSWFQDDSINLIQKLKEQLRFKKTPKFKQASLAYIHFLEKGGKITYKTLNRKILQSYLIQDIPILTGLSATYLYNEKREFGEEPVLYDDIKGQPSGHFVVLSSINFQNETINVSDPLHSNPFETQKYSVDIDHLICAILLGVITYDANLLIINKSN